MGTWRLTSVFRYNEQNNDLELAVLLLEGRVKIISVRKLGTDRLILKEIPKEIWYSVLGIIVVRFASYAIAAVKYHCFASLHTWLNKLTGAAVFLLPYVLFSTFSVVYSWAVCILAFAAALEELAIHLLREEYIPERKSFLQKSQGCL